MRPFLKRGRPFSSYGLNLAISRWNFLKYMIYEKNYSNFSGRARRSDLFL